jgi:hypothetical protein
MTETTAGTSTKSAGGLSKAADRIRASAQYLLAAFAAVGAILAAGLQIGNLGGVSFATDRLRALLAFAGILVAVVGISLAIAAAARVSPASYVSLNWLIANPDSEAGIVIEQESGLRQGMQLTALRDQIDAAVVQTSGKFEKIVQVEGQKPPGLPAERYEAELARLRAEYKSELASLEHLKSIRADVLEIASFLRTKSAYDRAKVWIVVGALVAAIGISSFAWGANPPKEVQAQPATIRWETINGQTAASISGVANLNEGIAAHLEVLGFPHAVKLYSSAADPTSPNSTAFNVTVNVPSQFDQIAVWLGPGSPPASCAPELDLPSGCSVVNVFGSSLSAPIFAITEVNGVMGGTVGIDGLPNSGHAETQVIGFHRDGASNVLIEDTSGVDGQGKAVATFSLPVPAGYLYIVVASGFPTAPSCLPNSKRAGCYTLFIPGDP